MRRTHLCALFLTCAVALPSFGQQKTFNWIPGGDETVSLDPGYYHGGPTVQPNAKTSDVRVDVDAQRPVWISTVSAQDWLDAAQHPEALQDLRYMCVQEHVVKATYTCTPPAGLPVVVVVRDERSSERRAYFGEVIARHDRTGQDTEHDAGTLMTSRSLHEFLSPNNVRLQYYDWACAENCNLPDPPQPKLFNWVAADSETVRLDPAKYYTSRTYNPSPQGGNVQVQIQARYPVTLAMVEPSAWTDATERPTAAKNVKNISYTCVQQHLLNTTYSCHLGGFWPQVLVIRDEREDDRDHDHDRAGDHGTGAAPRGISPGMAGSALVDREEERDGERYEEQRAPSPNDVRIQYYSWSCVQSCDQPDFGWVRQVKEKYDLTNVMKVYAGLLPDHNGTQVSIKVKSPVPMAVAVLPSPIAGQLYGKPDMFESAVAGSSCQQRGVQSSTFQCTLNLADGPQSLVLFPEAGVNIPNHKKAEVEVQTVKCIDNCSALAK
jgi:hypothetical protein